VTHNVRQLQVIYIDRVSVQNGLGGGQYAELLLLRVR
jgi:hypothetical protein